MTEIIEKVFTARTSTGYDFTAGWRPDMTDITRIEWYGMNSPGTITCQGYGEKTPRTWPAMEKLIARIGEAVERHAITQGIDIWYQQHNARYITGKHFRYDITLNDRSVKGDGSLIVACMSLPDESVVLPASDFPSWEAARQWAAVAIHYHQQGKRIPDIWEGPVCTNAKLYEPPVE